LQEVERQNCGRTFFDSDIKSFLASVSPRRRSSAASQARRDYFKRINDTLGHAAGERVLKSVAHCIEDSLRTYDDVGRFGGDEFVVILPDTPAAEAASALSAQPPCTPRT
jgi:diguanylate cyclase (GGDEF)-like protein